MKENISKEFCDRQVLRLNGLDRFPRTVEAIGELSKALRYAPTEDFAAKLISGYCSHATQCPRPADIRNDIFHATQEEPVTYRQLWPKAGDPSPTELSLLDEINRNRSKPYTKSELVTALKLIPQEHRILRRVELEDALRGMVPTIKACPCPACHVRRDFVI